VDAQEGFQLQKRDELKDLFTKEFLAINNGNYELETTCKLYVK